MLFEFVVLTLVLVSNVVHSTTVSNEDLQNYLNDVVAQYKVKLHKKATQEHASRRKRSVEMDDFQTNDNNASFGKFGSFYRGLVHI